MPPIDLKNDYPKIYQYFEEIDLLNNSAVRNRSDKGAHWSNLRNCAFLHLFDKPKIIWPLTADKWGFTLDNGKHYLTSGGFFLVSSSVPLKYILSQLNSKLIEYYFKFIGVMTAGGAYTLKKATIEKLPFVELSDTKTFEVLVDYILFLKTQPKDTQSFYFEQIIDGMVYERYFEKEIKKAGWDILKYLQDLPEITDDNLSADRRMSDSQKQKVITEVFNKLYNKNSPVRNNLFYMKSIEEIKIIEESLNR